MLCTLLISEVENIKEKMKAPKSLFTINIITIYFNGLI